MVRPYVVHYPNIYSIECEDCMSSVSMKADVATRSREALREGLRQVIGEPVKVRVTEAVPELSGLGGHLYIRELEHSQKVEWLRENEKDGENKVDYGDIRLVIACLVDSDNRPILSRDDIPWLTKGTAVVSKLSRIAARVSGLIFDAETALKNAGTTSPSNGQQPGGVS